MIEIVTKTGKRLGRISDEMTQDDIVYIEGRPHTLSDVYNDPKLLQRFNDEVKKTNAIKLQD